MVENLGGRCVLEVHSVIPALPFEYVNSISIGAALAPPDVSKVNDVSLGFSSPTELIEILKHPAMRQVKHLNVVGSSFGDELVPFISKLRLDSLTFTFTQLSKRGLSEILMAMPGCQTRYGNNGPHHVAFLHRNVEVLGVEPSTFAEAKDGDPVAMRSLLELSTTHDRDELDVLFEALSHLTKSDALELLEDAASDKSLEVRLVAVEALGVHDRLSVLVNALDDDVPAVRTQAVKSIAKSTSAQSVSVLLDALRNSYEDVRIQAAFSLRGRTERKVVQQLTRATRDASPGVRYEAIRSLGETGDSGIASVCLSALADEQATVRAAAARLLGTCGDSNSVGPLSEATQDQNRFVASNAKKALVELQSKLGQ